MASVIIAGDTSGSITLSAPAAAGSGVLTLPVATDTLVGKATTDTLTNKTLTSAVMNGTVGATTPATGAFTTLTSTLDATIYGVTVGRGAGAAATNTAVGASALAANTTASNNTAIGYFALNANTTGGTNVAVGTGALATNTTSTTITAVGYQALYNSNRTADTNDACTAVGYQSGLNKTTGNNNCFFGKAAGSNLTTGAGGIYIGQGCGASAAGNNNELVIGTQATGKGDTTGFISPGGGGVYQGNNSLSWSVTSDQRLKKNIVDNNVGLEKITAIWVRNFEYRLPEEVDAELKPTDAIKKEGVQLGVIAQELKAVFPECVKTESTGVMSVNPDALMWHMINAIKELKTIIDTQATRIAALETK